MSSRKLLYLFLLVLCSCRNDVKEEEKGTPVSGSFTLFTDKAFLPVANVLATSFCSVYPEIVITIDTGNGSEGLKRLADHRCNAVLSARAVSATDSAALASRSKFFRQFHIGSDAVALICNRADSLKFSGPQTPQQLLANCLKDTTITICTSSPASDDNLIIGELVPEAKACMAEWHSFSNTPDVISNVQENRGAVGIVSWSYLSETQNRAIMKIKEGIYVLPLINSGNDTFSSYPDQNSIAENKYALPRKIYLTTSEPYAGPAHGFASYVASDEGQRILRLFGLAPYKMPSREVEITR